MTFDKRFYGIYLGICVNNDDPEKNQRIQLIVPQVLGQETTQWADPCLPVIFNADHPDHIAHTAAQVAALLNNHSASTDMAGTGEFAHSHGVSVSSHSGNSGTLVHPHKTNVDVSKKWNGSSGTAFNDAADTKEHTPHRGVPNLDQKVWVMFVAGDPNFPIWMGVLP
jgi:hypothetical protein